MHGTYRAVFTRGRLMPAEPKSLIACHRQIILICIRFVTPRPFEVPETYCTNDYGLFGEPIKKWMPEGYVWEKSPGVIMVRPLRLVRHYVIDMLT